MNGRGPPLIALQAFVTVAEAGSVREAARRLGVGHSVVSRHLQTLQSWARCRLVETGKSGASLTEEGEFVVAAIGPAFQAIARLGQEFRPLDAQPLELWCSPGLASRWLTSRLGSLRETLGDRALLIRPTAQMPDLAHRGADAAIVFGPLQDAAPHEHRTTLCAPLFFPVASPSWIALNGRPVDAQALTSQSLLHEHSDDQWRQWLALTTGQDSLPPLPGARLWYANLALDAAEHGQGIALTNELLAAGAIAAGRLVRLINAGVPLDSYQLVVSSRRSREPALLRLRSWLTEHLRTTDA